jgi:redox-sensitive bicupin YhaK (pirin superfamily)
MTTPSPSPSAAAAGAAGLQGHPSLLLRPAAERFHSRHDWLDSHHSFSFAGHDDPAWRGFGPLRVINEDRIAAGRGFGMHPHSDMEIVTVMLDGVLRHRDSLGHSAELRAGEVQRMSAGTGIVHSEVNDGPDPCHLLQIWIEPSRRGIAPSYGQKTFAIGAGWTPLVDPDGAAGALAIQRPVRLWRARPPLATALDLPGEAGAHGWIQVIAGSLALRFGARGQGEEQISGEGEGQGDGEGQPIEGTLRAGDGLGFAPLGPGQGASLRALEPGTDLLVFSLR